MGRRNVLPRHLSKRSTKKRLNPRDVYIAEIRKRTPEQNSRGRPCLPCSAVAATRRRCRQAEMTTQASFLYSIKSIVTPCGYETHSLPSPFRYQAYNILSPFKSSNPQCGRIANMQTFFSTLHLYFLYFAVNFEILFFCHLKEWTVQCVLKDDLF